MFVLTQTEVQYSSDLCTVNRAAGTGLLTQATRGGVAEASEVSEATCTFLIMMRPCETMN